MIRLARSGKPLPDTIARRRGSPSRVRVGGSWILLIPASLLVLPLVVAFFLLLRYSFNAWNPVTSMQPAWTLKNYAQFFGQAHNISVLLRTLEIGVYVTAVALLLGYPLAYWISVSRRKNILVFIVVAPLMIDVLVRAYGWIVLLSRAGLVNQLLLRLHLIPAPRQFLATETAVVLELLHELLPFTVLPIASVLEKIDPRSVEAAVGLGASPTRAFLGVTLPLSLPGITTGVLLTFALASSAFVAPLILGGGRVVTLSILIQEQMAMALNWPLGAAESMVLVGLVGMCLFAYQRLQRG